MMLDELKAEYKKHIDSIGVDTSFDESGEFCDCATEGGCREKREELLKDIAVLEQCKK